MESLPFNQSPNMSPSRTRPIIFAHRVMVDCGHAPNPHHGCLTLTTSSQLICTESRQGDWLVGTAGTSQRRFPRGPYDPPPAQRIIYAARIAVVTAPSSRQGPRRHLMCDEFVYFGKNSPVLPDYLQLQPVDKFVKRHTDPQIVNDLDAWFQKQEKGVRGTSWDKCSFEHDPHVNKAGRHDSIFGMGIAARDAPPSDSEAQVTSPVLWGK